MLHKPWKSLIDFTPEATPQAMALVKGGSQVTETVTGPIVPAELKNPRPPNGIVQDAVPAPPNIAVIGQPCANVHASTEPDGVMTAVKNCSSVSPDDEITF